MAENLDITVFSSLTRSFPLTDEIGQCMILSVKVPLTKSDTDTTTRSKIWSSLQDELFSRTRPWPISKAQIVYSKAREHVQEMDLSVLDLRGIKPTDNPISFTFAIRQIKTPRVASAPLGNDLQPYLHESPKAHTALPTEQKLKAA